MKPSLAKASTADRENSTLRQQCNALSEQLGRVLLSVPAIGRLLANTTTISSEDLLLTTEEVQEAALRTIWLAHYYALARDLGVLPELAVAQAERWGSTAPPEEVLHRCAADVARRLREYTQGPGTTSQQQAAADAAAPATTDRHANATLQR
ncbi:hypothetical protein CHLRE_03g161578v5 [Chlamydomonas reinhardtii]|uniref:Uncharacterized protein n=1 Tax=Chlamydomonas reinhardtii TaxID=3055 RepID=A0A2K3DWF5_CHLRE|nr:uncharacterized protein CHLRE_03g161578v5 [Chlamydomonas reinhardtii]PNW84867.1 hypothetical protein CHLRE_03g161578v5 [Chlamydomonas reinhardtii]